MTGSGLVASAAFLPAGALAFNGQPTGINPPTGIVAVGGVERGFDWDTAIGSGEFTSIAAGHFTSVDRLDVAAMRGGDVGLLVQPGPYAGVADFGVSGLDMATLRGIPGTIDRLAVVGAGGLVTVRHHPAGGCQTGVLCPVVTTHETNDWTSATAVVSGALDSAHNDDLAAIAAGGFEILLALDNGAGGFTYESFIPNDRAHAIEIGDWDGAGDLEIVLSTDAGLQVYRHNFGPGGSQTPQLLHQELNIATEGMLARLPDQTIDDATSTVTDGFAWLTPHPNGTTDLLIILGDGYRELPVVVTAMGAVSMSAGSPRTDGLANLYFNSNAGYEVHVLHNLGGHELSDPTHQSFTYDPAAPSGSAPQTVFDYSTALLSPAQIVADVVVADFDLDGADDIMLGVSPLDAIAYIDGVDLSAPATATAMAGNAGMVPHANCYEFIRDRNGANLLNAGTLEFGVDYPTTLPSGTATTHIEVVVWTADDENSQASNQGSQHFLVDPSLHTIPAADPCSVSSTSISPLPGFDRVQLAVHLTPSTWDETVGIDWDEVYFIEYRAVSTSGPSSCIIDESGPSETLVWNRGANAEAYRWFDDDYWPLDHDVNLTIEGENSQVGLSGGEIAPGGRSDVPPIPIPGQVTCP